MAGALRIEAAGLAHTAVLVALYARCFDDPWSTGSMAAVLASPGALALVALRDEGGAEIPVGFALARHAGDEMEIISLGVVPECRRRGVAGCLMGEVLALARSRGSTRVVLEVAETNEAARALYAGYGFHAVGRRPDYYQRANSVPVAALTMALDLLAPRAEAR